MDPLFLLSFSSLNKKWIVLHGFIRSMLTCSGWITLPPLALHAFADCKYLFEHAAECGRPLIKSAKRAWLLHAQQEATAHEILSWSWKIKQCLAADGGAVSQHDSVEAEAACFTCHCGQTFTTRKQLANHKWSGHGETSVERTFIQDASCPACGLFLWTTARVYEHLSYIPQGRVNTCFQWLNAHGVKVGEYQAVHKPPHLRGINRLDAFPLGTTDFRKAVEEKEAYRERVYSDWQQLLHYAEQHGIEGRGLQLSLTATSNAWHALRP